MQAVDNTITLHIYAECNSWEDTPTIEYRLDRREQDIGASNYSAWKYLGTCTVHTPEYDLVGLDKSSMFVEGLTAQLASERAKFAARVTELQGLIQSHLALPDTTREVARGDLAEEAAMLDDERLAEARDTLGDAIGELRDAGDEHHV